MTSSSSFLFLLAAAPPFALPAASAQMSFSDQSAAVGLVHTHCPDPDHPANPMHAGGTVGDFNGDGRPDLFLVGGGTPDRLFINHGGVFVDEAAAWGLTDLYWGMGAVAADYDGDGWQDLFVTSFGEPPGPPAGGRHRLYRNTGTGSFVELAAAAGVNSTGPVEGGTGAVFGDYDLDGDLDLYVCNWVAGSFGNRLFKNKGNGTFRDVTVAAGLQDGAIRGFTPRFVDMNGDRYPELLIAADFSSSRLFVNNRDGTFTDGTVLAGAGEDENGMGSAVGDFNRDGRCDWMVTSIFGYWPGGGTGNRLYMNAGANSCPPLPESAGVNDGGWGWGVTAVDLDHDGWLDLAGTNGWPSPSPWTDDPSWVFRNRGDETFEKLGACVGLTHTCQGRALLHLDYDADGDMDLVIVSFGQPVKLFRNDLPETAGNWVQFDLEPGAHAGVPPHGLGARLALTAGGATQHLFVDGGPTYLGRSQLTAHAGLGAAVTVDELVVEWPDGFQTVLRNLVVNQRSTITAVRPLSQSELVRGQIAQFTVQGARPGEWVWLLYSRAGEGPGPSKPLLGGMALDLLPPVRTAGSAIADAGGTALITAAVPANAPLASLSTQAVIARGTGGAASAKSNVITAPVLP